MTDDLFGNNGSTAGTRGPIETRRCPACVTTPGVYVSEAFTCSFSKRGFPRRESPCHVCEGTPDIPRPDFRALLLECKGRKGIRTSRPKSREAYYLWRMARFAGEADVTMPVNALSEMRQNPWLKEYDAVADLLAQWAFGTKMAAAHRWGMAMGRITTPVPGLPDSAYPCGRVADVHKPLEEMAELI